MINLNTIPISNYKTYNMETLGVMIRKWDKEENGTYSNPTKKQLTKQIKTLHKKLKKEDNIYTEFTIEKDKYENKYHTHLIIHYEKDERVIYERLSHFVSGNNWKKRSIGLESYNECNGKYGLIHTQPINNIKYYRWYINKFGDLQTLI
jgi:hypothetical protein